MSDRLKDLTVFSEEYEKLGYEGVFAITACFSQEPLS